MKSPKSQSNWTRPPSWPRSDDVREWMLALLRLTPQLGPNDVQSTVVLVAVCELARVSRIDEALAAIENLLKLVDPKDASAQFSFVRTAAEIAYEAGHLDAMERYLQRLLALQPLFIRKCDRGWTQKSVDAFRSSRGLLDPSDKMPPEMQTQAHFWKYLRDVSMEATPVASRTLSLANELIPKMETWRRAHARSGLLRAAYRIGARALVSTILAADAEEALKDRIGHAVLFEIDETDRALNLIESKAQDALAELRRGSMNAHFPAMTIESAIADLSKRGYPTRAETLLAQALEEGTSWNLAAPGAFSSSVFASMARAVAAVRGRDAALSLVQVAVEKTQADRTSHWKAAATKSNAELMIELSSPDQSEALAKSVRSPKARRNLLAKIYARRSEWDRLHLLLDACKTPLDAMNLIWDLKFIWRPAK